MRSGFVQAGLVAIVALAAPVAAQELRPGVFGAAAVANVYRAEDRSFGTKANLGGGIGVEWKRLGVDAEIHDTLGLTPRAVQCGVVNVTCVGSANEGIRRATMFSGNVSYSFTGAGIRPYVIGSVGVLWTESVNSLTVVRGGAATLSEFRERHTGLALGLGFGVDIPLTRALSVRPEFRTYSSSALSRMNVGMHRGTVGVRYRW